MLFLYEFGFYLLLIVPYTGLAFACIETVRSFYFYMISEKYVPMIFPKIFKNIWYVWLIWFGATVGMWLLTFMNPFIFPLLFSGGIFWGVGWFLLQPVKQKIATYRKSKEKLSLL